MHRFRIAPTPSGYLHAGNEFNIRSIVEWQQKIGGEILLRIDDLDALRVRPEYVEDIFHRLNAWGIRWDMGPRGRQELEQVWSQSLRMEFYQSGMVLLHQTGWIYPCSCSRKALQASACPCRPTSFPVPPNSSHLQNFQTQPPNLFQNLKFPFSIFNPNLPDTTVWRKDGFPAYQLSSLLDDLLFQITHIVRGTDLLPSTEMQTILNYLLNSAWNPHSENLTINSSIIINHPSQSILPLPPEYKNQFLTQWENLVSKLNLRNNSKEGNSKNNSMDWPPPNPFQFHRCTFKHHPLITDSNGEKLSKSIKPHIPK